MDCLQYECFPFKWDASHYFHTADHFPMDYHPFRFCYFLINVLHLLYLILLLILIQSFNLEKVYFNDSENRSCNEKPESIFIDMLYTTF